MAAAATATAVFKGAAKLKGILFASMLVHMTIKPQPTDNHVGICLTDNEDQTKTFSACLTFS